MSHCIQVERGLFLWKEGTNAAQSVSAEAGTSKRSQRSPQYEFGNDKWGGTTKNYARSTALLKEQHWDSICRAAFQYSDENLDELQEIVAARGVEVSFVDPRAAIVLDD